MYLPYKKEQTTVFWQCNFCKITLEHFSIPNFWYNLFCFSYLEYKVTITSNVNKFNSTSQLLPPHWRVALFAVDIYVIQISVYGCGWGCHMQIQTSNIQIQQFHTKHIQRIQTSQQEEVNSSNESKYNITNS